VTLFEITPAERAGWQQRAARELVAILDAHPDLPVIAWTVASAGSILVGHVSGTVSADQLRRTFDTWRQRLLLTPPEEVRFRDGSLVVKATSHRNRVRVTVTATLPPERDGEVTP
jgi:hypothetical protein